MPHEWINYDEAKKVWRLPASVAAITDELQRAYGSGTLSSDDRSVQFPKRKWVRKALDRLVDFKIAVPPSDSGDKFEILFRPFRDDALERFVKMDSALTHQASAQMTSDAEPLLPFPEIEEDEE